MNCIKVYHYALYISYNDCSVRVYRSFNTIFHQMFNTAIDFKTSGSELRG